MGAAASSSKDMARMLASAPNPHPHPNPHPNPYPHPNPNPNPNPTPNPNLTPTLTPYLPTTPVLALAPTLTQAASRPLHEAIDRIVQRLATDPNSISGQS